MTQTVAFATKRFAQTIASTLFCGLLIFAAMVVYPYTVRLANDVHDRLFPVITTFEVLHQSRTKQERTVLVYMPGSPTPIQTVIPVDSLEVYGRLYKADGSCEYRALTWYVKAQDEVMRRVAVIFGDQVPGASPSRIAGVTQEFGPWYILDQAEKSRGERYFAEAAHQCGDGRLRRTLLDAGAFFPGDAP